MVMISVPLVVAVLARVGTLALALLFNAGGKVQSLGDGRASLHTLELGGFFIKVKL